MLALAGAATAGPEVTELKVEVESVPEGCSVKSKNGDMLTMHYTGTLDDGHKFDSRLVELVAKILIVFAAQQRRGEANLFVQFVRQLYLLIL